MTTLKRRVAPFVGLMGVVAACVGDDPMGQADPQTDRPDGSVITDGQRESSSSGEIGSSSGATDSGVDDASPDSGIAPGVAVWGIQLDGLLHADARAGFRAVALRTADSGQLSAEIRWYGADGAQAGSLGLSSTASFTVTGLRVDESGDVYISIDHRALVQAGASAVPYVDAEQTPQCSIARIARSSGALTWTKNFRRSGGPSGQVTCNVRRIDFGNVLVSGSFRGGALRAGDEHAANGTGAYGDNGFVATLAATSGARTFAQSFGTNGGTGDFLELADAHFTSATQIAAVGTTTSTKVLRGAALDQVIVAWPAPTGGEDASRTAIYLRVDTASPANTSGEAWSMLPVDPSAPLHEYYNASTWMQSVTGNTETTVITGALSGDAVATLRIPGTAPAAFGSSNGAFIVSIPSVGPRQTLTRETGNSSYPTGMTLGSGGRMLVVGGGQQALSFGAACQRAASDVNTTFIAFFASSDLASCQELRSFRQVEAHQLSGNESTGLLRVGRSGGADTNIGGFAMTREGPAAIELTY